MRPGLHAENGTDAEIVKAVLGLRDELIAKGADPSAIGIAMISIGAGATCGIRAPLIVPAQDLAPRPFNPR